METLEKIVENDYGGRIKDDFEKLTIARLFISKLQIEIGILQSEKEELRHELVQIKKLTTEEKIEIKRGVLYENLQNEIKSYKKKMQKLKRDNEDLLCKLIKLNNK